MTEGLGLREDHPHRLRFFDKFAFVVYASREEPPADILNRSIIVRCEKNTCPTAKRIDRGRPWILRLKTYTHMR